MKGTLPVLAVVALAAAGSPAAATDDDQHDFVLTLATERSDYYVGEPLRLGLTIKSESDHDIYGFFRLWPPDDRTTVLYRRAGEPFRALGRVKSDAQSETVLNEVDVVTLPMKLAPKQEKRTERQIVLDPATGQVILEAAGDYEFAVECRLWSAKGSGKIVRSDTAVVHVTAPTDAEREALSEFLAKGLAGLVEVWPFPPVLQSGSIANAAAFLDHHPRGRYSDKVRDALVRGLRHRVLRSEANEHEKALYEKMKAERDEP